MGKGGETIACMRIPKYLFAFISGCFVIAQTVLPLFITPETASYLRWKIFGIGFGVVAILALALQLWVQARDEKRDQQQAQKDREKLEKIYEQLFSAAPSASVEPSPTISADDPRLYPEFLDERGSTHFHKKTAIMVHNRGVSVAHDVSIETIPLRENSVSFPISVGFIPPESNARFEPKMEGRWGIFSENFVSALVKEWDSYNDLNKKTLELPLRIVYRNFAGTALFETRCNIILDPFVEVLPRTYGAPHHGRPAIRFSSPEFRKVFVQPKKQVDSQH
jgi:hypothetical protein